MKVNMGSVDRILRLILGVALVAATVSGFIGPWGWLGLVAIATALFRFCPAYLPFGLSTCKLPK